MHIPLFRIWYSTTFTVLFIIFIILAGTTPGNLIWLSVASEEFDKVAIVGGCIIFTVVISAFIWASRLYTNRTILAAIPKSYIPVEPGEVSKNVRRMIQRQLERSALIAWESRPRDVKRSDGFGDATERHAQQQQTSRRRSSSSTRQRKHAHVEIIISPDNPPWGVIAHLGWSAPGSDDLPNLQFATVISELPNLIEAKAVSLAPADPFFPADAHDPASTPNATASAPIPDARIVALLQRPAAMTLRDYLAQLSTFNLINPPHLVLPFLTLYEAARFSKRPLPEPQFRELTSIFGQILAGMGPLDTDLVADLLNEAPSLSDEGDIPMPGLEMDGIGGVGPAPFLGVGTDNEVASVSSGGSAIHYRTPNVGRSMDLGYFGPPISSGPMIGHSGSSDGSQDTVLTAHSRFAADTVSLASSAGSVVRHSVPDVEHGRANSPTYDGG